MRKDVQLGLAIGGVFLAVLIVWGLVVSGSHKPARQGATLDTSGHSTAANPSDRSTDVPPPISHSDIVETARSPVTNAPDHVAPDRAAADQVASGTTPDSASADPAKAPSDKKETNWSAIILAQRPEDLPAPLRTTTPPLSASADAGSAAPAHLRAVDAPATPVAAPEPGSLDPVLSPATAPSAASPDATAVASNTHLKTHTVQRGESFYTISKAVYGDARFFGQIAKANPTVNPSKLRPGMVINLPDAAAMKADAASTPRSSAAPSSPASATPAAAPAAVDSKTEYRVASGDSLYKISMHLYGSGEEVEHLYDLNKAAIGPDRGKLKLGMVLKLPAAPTATASR